MKLESLEELAVFSQVAELGNMTAAGRVLGLPATTVSRRIASLEERVGVRLLDRTTRSVGLSEHGRAFLAQARRVLEAVDEAEASLRAQQEGLAGVVRLGLPSLLTADVLTGLTPLLLDHPELRLEVVVQDTPVNPVSVGLDVLIMGGAMRDSSLVARKLDEVELVLAASADYLARFGEPASVEELAAHRTLHFRGRATETSWTLTHADGRQQVVPLAGQLEADDGRAIVDAMRCGLGIGKTSARVIRAYPELRRVLPELHVFRFPLYAIYPASGARSARLTAVVTALSRVVS